MFETESKIKIKRLLKLRRAKVARKWPVKIKNIRLLKRYKATVEEKCSILFRFTKGKKIALTLHTVQPQTYIEYFGDSAKG